MTDEIDYKIVSEQYQRENEELRRRLALILMKRSYLNEIGNMIDDCANFVMKNLNKIVLILNGIFIMLGIVWMVKSFLFKD